MAIPWYFAPVIFLIAIFVLNIVLLVLYKLLKDPNSCCGGKDTADEETETEAGTLAEEEKVKQVPEDQASVSYYDGGSSISSKLEHHHVVRPPVTVVSDATADSSLSGDEDDRSLLPGVVTPISAYGESIVSESEFRFVAESVDGEYMRIHVSLIYSGSRRYVAGKVSQVEGLKFNQSAVVDQLKVHVVFLPLKKYILRTKYYKVNPSADNCRLDEYFKMKFRKKPDPGTSALRFRVYGRKTKLAFSGKERCLGETKVNFSEFASLKGGITLRRSVLPPL